MKMKILSVFAAGAVMMALASCGGDKAADTTAGTTPEDTAAETPKTLRLNVFLTAADEQKRAEAIATARKLIEPSQKEEGCISYDMYESVTTPGEFIIVETWESQEALDRHMKQPHFIEYATKLDEYGDKHADRFVY